ncbi:uncharacterized protein [Asterias amurensis]|uniref:uncharacterized protein n=1 Tax=Asterias amurensis TaxID=7602 RepID=UPI003AB510F0
MAQAGVEDVRGSHPPPSIDIIDVSRTVQSTDLFTPYREPRVTLPTIGEFQQNALPFGGKYWGGPLTEYGGIGDLSFRSRQRVRDLEVTRSHRHYRSGFSKYLTDIQPYRRTELHLSECRLNDQILPAPLQADISRLNWQREHPWPDSRAYGTHHSIFEVFPPVKPELPLTEKEPHHNYRSRNAQPLVKATQEALLELSRKLFQSTLYQDSYLNYCKPRQNSSTTASLLPRQPGQLQPHPPKDDISDTITSSTQLAKSDSSEKDEENEEDEEQTSDQEDCLSGDEEANEEDGNGEEGETNDVSSDAVTTDDDPQTPETTIRRFEIKPNKQMTGIGPCWPPGSSYVIENINGAQMLERRDIVCCHSNATPLGEKKQQRLMSARRRLSKRYEEIVAGSKNTGSSSSLVANLKSKDAILKQKLQQLLVPNPPNQIQEPTLQTNHITAPLPDADRDVTTGTALRLPALHSSQKLDSYSPFLIPTSYHDRLRKLSSVPWSPCRGTDVQTEPTIEKSVLTPPGVTWKGKTQLVLPPAPLADCLSSSGTRVPHKLGLRYKSEAHKRYHLMHPDIIPDLRTKEGKKYFFCGFHSSVFRG